MKEWKHWSEKDRKKKKKEKERKAKERVLIDARCICICCIYENVRYDKLKKPYSHEIIGPLGQGVGVCEGIAKAVKVLCDALGLWCMIAICAIPVVAKLNRQINVMNIKEIR